MGPQAEGNESLREKQGGRQMKLAVATENGQVAEHFGHCPEFTIYDVEDTQVKAKR